MTRTLRLYAKLGDVLNAGCFFMPLAEEEGVFTMQDVIEIL